MKVALCGVVVGLTLILSIWTNAFAQDPNEVFAPTTLMESSPELAGAYSRISGKIEASVSNPALAEQLQARLATWLEAAGEKSPTTYDVAHDRLRAKLNAVNAAFDAARASGSFDNWPTQTRPGTPTPAAAPQAPAAAAPPAPEAPAPTPSPAPEPPATSVSTQAPAAPAAQISAPAPTATPAAPPQVPEVKSAGQAPKDPASEKQSEEPQASQPTWQLVLGGILAFLVALALWKIYPRVFQPRADTYTLSAWGRLKKRATFTVIWTFVVLIVASAALTQ